MSGLEDEFAERIRRRLWEAYSLDEMTPEERADFEAYGRLVEQARRQEEAFRRSAARTQEEYAAAINADPGVLEPLVPGIGAVMAEHGLRFAVEPDPRDRLPRRRNPRIGCYEHANGTWIHGRPHDCPKWPTP